MDEELAEEEEVAGAEDVDVVVQGAGGEVVQEVVVMLEWAMVSTVVEVEIRKFQGVELVEGVVLLTGSLYSLFCRIQYIYFLGVVW